MWMNWSLYFEVSAGERPDLWQIEHVWDLNCWSWQKKLIEKVTSEPEGRPEVTAPELNGLGGIRGI